MEVSKETEKDIAELRALEQNMQNLMMQKQAFQMELSEIENSLSEVEKTKDDVFKISGNIMIKASKEDIVKELKERKGFVDLRLKTFENQERTFSESSESLRKRVLAQIKKK